MVENKRYVLYVYKEHIGLPAIDYKCLQALFIVRMMPNDKVEIKRSGFYITPYLPMLEYHGQFYTTQVNILKKLELILDNKSVRSKKEQSRIEAYKTLTFQTFEPCIALNFWGNERNCQQLLRVYGNEKYFPFRLIFLRRMSIYVQDAVLRYTSEAFNENSETNVYKSVESYLLDISHLLTINKYLLGDIPSILDAFVCGYLVPIYALNLPDKTLKTILLRHDVVVQYLLNFLKYYNIQITQDKSVNGVEDQNGNDGRASFGLLATAGFVALAIMIGYGVVNDIFKTD